MMRFIEVRFDNSPNSGYRLSLNDSSLKIRYEFFVYEIFKMKSFCKLTCVKTFDRRDSSGLLGQSTFVQFWKTPSEIQIIRRGAWVVSSAWWKFQITMARVTLPIDDMVYDIPYIRTSYDRLYIFFIRNFLPFYVIWLNSLKDSYQLISRTLIRSSRILFGKLCSP